MVREAEWPSRLVEICASLRAAGGLASTESRARAWILLRDVLHASLRRESARFRSVTPEDIDDVASTKALDLLTRAERGEWNPSGRSRGEIVLYLRSTAHHGLLRLLEQQGRVVPMNDPETDPSVNRNRRSAQNGPVPAPEHSTEAREFATGLVGCLSCMQPRARLVWCLRAVYELSSREIASHPDVLASGANVDMILMRARAHLKECLATKGFEPGPLPAGTVALIWERMILEPPSLLPHLQESVRNS